MSGRRVCAGLEAGHSLHHDYRIELADQYVVKLSALEQLSSRALGNELRIGALS